MLIESKGTRTDLRFGVTNGPWLFYGKAGGGWVGNNSFTITNVCAWPRFALSDVGHATRRAVARRPNFPGGGRCRRQ